MKNIFFILVQAFFLSNCNEDNVSTKINHPITGSWHLISYEPGFSPTSFYKNEEVTWVFYNDGKLVVKIKNGTSINNSMPLSSDGNYLYTITDKLITLKDFEYDYSIENETLTISNNPAADGKRLIFQKVVK